MAIAAQTQSIIRAGLDASAYVRGADQIEQANRDIAQSGETVVRAQESQERAVRATERTLHQMERRLGLNVAMQREYERALARVADAELRGLRTADQAAAIRQALEARYLGAARGAQALATATNAGILASGRFRTVIQQAGFQVGDFATQVAAGGNALTAFVQQGSQLLGLFGAGGAIAGAVLAIGGVAANMLLVGRNTETATEATLSYSEAMRLANELSGEAAGLAREIAEAKRAETIATQRNALAVQEEAAAKLSARIREFEAVRALGRFDAASEQDQTDTFTAVGRNLERARAELERVNEAARIARIRLAEAEQGVGQFGERAERSARGGGRSLAETLTKLNEEADRAARTVVEKLLRESESEWERYTREVAEAEAAMARLNVTTAEQARIRRVLAERSPEARATRELVEQQRKAAEREAEEFARIWQRATDTAVEKSGDFFFDLFTGRANSIGETLRLALLRAVADAAANFLLRPIIAPIIGAVGSAVGGLIGMPGAGGGNPFGAIGNLLGLGSSAYTAATGQSLLGGLGLSSLMSTPVLGHSAAAAGLFAEASAASMGLSASQASMLAGAGPTFGALAGAGGLGFGAGALLGAFGASPTVSSIGGGAIGAGAGFLLGGPIGAIVGGLGGIVGGIFGGARQGFSGGTSVLGVDPQTGQLVVLGDTGKRYDVGSIASAVTPEVQQVNALLASGGIRINAAGLPFNPLSSTIPFAGYGPGQGDGAQYGQSVEQVLMTLIKQGRLTSDNATLNRVLGSGGVTSLASLQEGIAFAALFDQLKNGADTTTQLERAMKQLREQLAAAEEQAKKYGFAQGEVTKATRDAFDRDIRRELLGITDPLKLALEDFDRAAKERLEVAKTLGADLVQVERLTQLQRKQLIEQTSGGTARSLSGLVDDIVFGGLSSGAPSQRYFSAVQRLNQASRDALADPSNAEARAAFEEAARAALPLARDFLGTSTRYAALEAEVLSTARRLDPAADPAGIAAQKIVDSQALATSLQVGATNAVRAELVALRADFNRLADTVAALARRAA